jgi:terminase small subunit-like protein
MKAFRQAGYSASSAQQNAHRLSENEGVKARIAELSARNAEKCQLSRDEAVQYLVEILKTPISEVTADHRLAQSYDAKSGKIELPNKLGAMQLLAKMCGWNEPEKHEFEHGFKERQELVEVIARLRGRGAVRNR